MSDDDNDGLSPRIDVAIGDAAWRGALPGAAACCRRAAGAAFAEAARPDGARSLRGAARPEVSILLADDRAVGALNRRYRGKCGATNVLAFPGVAPAAQGAPLLLGDIVLARETVVAEARAAALALADRVSHLVVHGALHLLGYDHEEDDAAVEMQAAEARALRRVGVADPYRGREAGR